MSTAPPDSSATTSPSFRDTLRGLPSRVWLISIGALINQVGNFLPIFITLYLVQRGYSAGLAGVVLGVSGVARVLGNTVGGHLADKLGRRWTIVGSAVANAGLVASVPFLESMPAIIVVVGLGGMASQISRPAAASVLIDSVETHQQRLAAFGVLRFAQNLGFTLGGGIGGVLASISYEWLFLANAATGLLFGVFVAVLLRGTPRSRSDDEDADTQTDRSVGYRRAFSDRVLVRFLLMTVCAELVYTQVTVGLPLHINDVGLSDRHFGYLMGLSGLLVLVLELPITALASRYRPEYMVALGNLVIGVGLALTGFAVTMGPLLATMVVWTFGEMLSTSIGQAHVANLTPPGMVGRYQGLYGAASTTGICVGPVIGGAVYAIEPSAMWVGVAVLGLLSALLALPRRRAASEVVVSDSLPSGSDLASSRK
ncbi:MFS transporter [Micromonospora halophytica]|uniref:Predicted arabinose efflux permease, MFS family n=1 Tax=Micromonospora halophytica TaxID=47864 RepID=A0A1C5JFG0_9ACTN|nr:MFS transporter [Micromonospora halophytica]SCG69300.1 Predicted arabinose efflux permease, MFS family [Micromonospora halophytica]